MTYSSGSLNQSENGDELHVFNLIQGVKK